jgi:hypothetical protein
VVIAREPRSRLPLHLGDKVQHEVIEQLRSIDDNTGKVFDTERRLFQESLSTPNIRKVVVNGVPIKLDATPTHRRL